MLDLEVYRRIKASIEAGEIPLLNMANALELDEIGLNEQIMVREHLINNMVGGLYTSILRDQIVELRKVK